MNATEAVSSGMWTIVAWGFRIGTGGLLEVTAGS